MDYTTREELHNLIKKVVCEKYMIASANIIYLEQLELRNFVVYMTQFRDSLTHLVNIYSVDDILNRKDYILEQLERINGHLERIVIDSYRKICDSLLGTIRKTKKWKDIHAMEVQIALKIKELRVCDNDMTFDKKKDGFQELVTFLEDIIKK